MPGYSHDFQESKAAQAGGGSISLLDMAGAAWMTQVLYAACELGIPEALAGGEATTEAVARRCGCDADALGRLMGALATLRICGRDEHGQWWLAPLGKPLLGDHPESVRAWVLWWGRNLWSLWGELASCVRTGKSARQLLQGRTGYDHLDGNGEAARLFHEAMAGLTRIQSAAILRAYDFSGARRIVDIAGGNGALLFAILAAWPDAQGVLYDLPHAIQSACQGRGARSLHGRCTFASGSFFDAIPAGADLYLLKSIIHNWDDASSRQILENCARAMDGGSRLLVVERVLSEDGTSPAAAVRSDLNMLVSLGGKERSTATICGLLEQAGLEVARILPTSLEFTLFEAVRSHRQ
ncbi:methyltransferase [Noviherbaspirillum galbum]|uniref:Methyltransferase n=1 Tax=Noviherbaspirillum galbum TaxID=2709383 RepID=A0A6B3SNQ0_9BURK|nr:methyltransferase [Noviherbaspirillum galbum]NEX62128.1 hypothetical protein [Noviherbaspirillum galbum]